MPSVDNRTILQSAKLNSPSPSKSVNVKIPGKSPLIAIKGQQRAHAKLGLQSKPGTRRTLKLLAQDSEHSVNVVLECPLSFMTFPVHSSLFPDDDPEFAFSMEEMVGSQVFSLSDPLTDQQADASPERSIGRPREKKNCQHTF